MGVTPASALQDEKSLRAFDGAINEIVRVPFSLRESTNER